MGSVTEWRVVVGLTESDVKALITEEYESLYDFMEENLPAQFELSCLNSGYDQPPDIFGVTVCGGDYHQYLDLMEVNVYTQDVIKTLNHYFCTNKFAVYIGTYTY